MRYLDANEFLAEAAREPIVVELFGQKWQLPARGEVPALTIFRQRLVLRHAAELARLKVDEPVPAHLTMLHEFDTQEHMEAFLGADNLTAWYERGITEDLLTKVMGWVVIQHLSRDRDDDSGEEPHGPEAGAPAEGATQTPTGSSTTGQRSKPTSAASTKSASPLS